MTTAPAEAPLVFVVEDDHHIAAVLQFLLQRAGYRVALATDGRAAQTFIESQPPPAAALLDLMLPFMDGIQLTALARAQPAWRHVPVLMLTAKTREEDMARAMAAGANGYVQKPFQPADLLSQLALLAPPKAE